MRVAAASKCPLGFNDSDLPPGTELPAAWRVQPSPSDDAPALSRAADAADADAEAHLHASLPSALVRPSRPGRTHRIALACPSELNVEVTTAAEALFADAANHARAAAEARCLEFRGQLLPAICFGLSCGLAAAARHLLVPLLALAVGTCGAAGVYSYQRLGAAPNARAGSELLAQGAWRAAESALSWAYDDAQALQQLAEARRRQGNWRGATTAMLRWQPQDAASARLWGLQMDAIAAHQLDALQPLPAAGEPRRKSRSPDGGPSATRPQVRWSTPAEAP